MHVPTQSDVSTWPEFKAWIEDAAEEGVGYAHWKLAISYLDGRFGEFNRSRAIHHLKIAAESGVRFAAFYLVEMFEANLIEDDAFRTRAYYLDLGAKMGESRCQLKLAKYLMLSLDASVPKLQEIRRWLQLAEWNSNGEAKAWGAYIDAIGSLPCMCPGEALDYLKSKGVAQNFAAQRAGAIFQSSYEGSFALSEGQFDLLLDAAQHGDKEAICDLVEFSLGGGRSPVEGSEDRSFLELVEDKYPRALLLQARTIFEASESTDFFREIAISLLEEAVQESYLPATIYLADIRARSGDKDSLEKALEGYLYAQKEGLGDAVIGKIAETAEALLSLGDHLDQRLRALLELGAHSRPQFLWRLAHCVSGQNSYPRKPKLLMFWLVAGVMDGLPSAARVLALELEEVQPYNPRRDPFVLSLMEYSAFNGDHLACAIVGDHYMGERNKLTNAQAAFYWYEKSAALGYVDAMKKVIWCLANNFGVQSNAGAIGYWEKALAAKVEACPEDHAPTATREPKLKEGKLIDFKRRG